MEPKERFYPESRFGGFTDLDGTLLFYARVQSFLRRNSVVVDFGCGRGPYQDDPVVLRHRLRDVGAHCSRVIGLDVDEAARSNPMVDEFHLLENNTWPLADEVADVCIADFVIEHLREPEHFFRECARVLRTNGIVCIRTSNGLGYPAIVSRLVPKRLHRRVLRLAQPNREERDVFRAFYRCNTIPAMRRALVSHGFDAVVYGHEAEPSYLAFSSLAYGAGVLLQKYSPSLFKAAIFAFGKLEEGR